MGISRNEVLHVARLARLALSEEEVERFRIQLEQILGYVDQIKEVDVSGVEAAFHTAGSEAGTALRADEVQPPLPRHELMGNAPQEQEGFFKVPRVLD